jgi:hypothetical protein
MAPFGTPSGKSNRVCRLRRGPQKGGIENIEGDKSCEIESAEALKISKAPDAPT